MSFFFERLFWSPSTHKRAFYATTTRYATLDCWNRIYLASHALLYQNYPSGEGKLARLILLDRCQPIKNFRKREEVIFQNQDGFVEDHGGVRKMIILLELLISFRVLA